MYDVFNEKMYKYCGNSNAGATQKGLNSTTLDYYNL